MRVWSEPGADKLKFNFLCFHVKFYSSELLNALNCSWLVGWLVVLGLTALSDNISVYIGPSPKEREKEKRKDR